MELVHQSFGALEIGLRTGQASFGCVQGSARLSDLGL